jgi:UPF0716 protein FxsA
MRFLLVLLPWLELLTLIQLGVETSALMALAYVFLTLFLGLALLRRQGEGLVDKLRRGDQLGPQLLMDDMAIGFAGLLLMVPGLITDFMSLLVLIGPLRRRIALALGWREVEQYSAPNQRHGDDVIEGEFHRVDSPENR